MRIDSDVHIECSLNKNHYSYQYRTIDKEEDIVCKDCYEEIKSELEHRLDIADQEIIDLKTSIDELNTAIKELEEFKDRVISSEDCPKWVSALVVSEKL